jgi:formate dehydrogenase subunit delta
MSAAHFEHDNRAKLVRMANQIGDFFESQPEPQRVPGIADHIGKFWDKRMRREIYAHVDAGGAGLHPAVIEALARLKAGEKRL